jgi:hypothetical protein
VIRIFEARHELSRAGVSHSRTCRSHGSTELQ